MAPFWVTFVDGQMGCCEGDNIDVAKKIAEKKGGREVKTIETLPYPASPIIYQFAHPLYGTTPTFCLTPRECAGKTSCPRRISCTD